MGMGYLIYGPEKPKLSFSQSPDGSIEFKIENKNVFRIDFEEQKGKSITWYDLYPHKHKLHKYDLPKLFQQPFHDELPKEDEDFLRKEFKLFTSNLGKLTETKGERNFFDGYVLDPTLYHSEGDFWIEPAVSLWQQTALIPQVWVNWIHYDSKDEDRAIRALEEPFRVDFVMKDGELSDQLIIIEIDGESHFGKFYLDPVGKFVLEASMEEYTKHIQKDRWLRNQGWSVYRITMQEIEQALKKETIYCIENLLREVFGKPKPPLSF